MKLHRIILIIFLVGILHLLIDELSGRSGSLIGQVKGLVK